jgi:hypothetical protein
MLSVLRNCLNLPLLQIVSTTAMHLIAGLISSNARRFFTYILILDLRVINNFSHWSGDKPLSRNIARPHPGLKIGDVVNSTVRANSIRASVLLSLLAVAAAAMICLVYPAVPAAICPSCYGFAPAGDSIYVEADVPEKQVVLATTMVRDARDRVRRFYGTLQGRPRILLCFTDHCYRRFGTGSRGMALLDRALILAPRGMNVVIAAHELAHIELHSRLGARRTWFKTVPQWFDEGLAVLVSDDPRYLSPNVRAGRCHVAPDVAMPDTRIAWIERARSAGLYAQAACRVSRWVISHGGPPTVLSLTASIAAGKSFEAAAAGGD